MTETNFTLVRTTPCHSPTTTATQQPMTTRRAACNCGQLCLTIEGEPSRISMYHCFECQRRTGAVISNQARFRREQLRGVTLRRGRGDPKSGNALTFHFWPVCGSAVYWEAEGFPGYAAVGKPGLVSPSCKNRQKSREGCSLDHALRWAVATWEERPRIGRKFRHTDRYAVLRQERGRSANAPESGLLDTV